VPERRFLMKAMHSRRPSVALVVALLALFVALGGTAGAVVTAVVPLAKRALVADNAKKLNGLTAKQLGGAAAVAAVKVALQQSPPGAREASTAAGLVTRKSAAATIGAGAAQAYTIACDTGQKVLGGGFASDGPLIVAVASGPTDDATWTIGLLNFDDAAGHNINLYATCIK
jgi:hypothetical protein